MDGSSRAFGAPVDWEVGDQVFWILPLTVYRLSICEAHLLAMRPTPVQKAMPFAARMDGRPEAQWELLSRACRATLDDQYINKIKTAELLRWLMTTDGLRFSARLCLRTERGRRVTKARAEKLLSHPLDAEDFRRRRDQVSGTDILADLDWSDEPDEDPLWWRAKRRAEGRPDPPKRNKKEGPIQWRHHLQSLAQSMAAWDWRIVARMTIYQLKTYQSEPEQLRTGGIEALPVQYAETYSRYMALGKDFKPQTDEEREIVRRLRRVERQKRLEEQMRHERADEWAARLVRRLNGVGSEV